MADRHAACNREIERLQDLVHGGMEQWQRAERAEAERDALRAAVRRVRELCDRWETADGDLIVDVDEVRAALVEPQPADTPADIWCGTCRAWHPDAGGCGCPTCSFPARETVGMVCQTCGTNYGVPSAGGSTPDPADTCESTHPDYPDARCSIPPGHDGAHAMYKTMLGSALMWPDR